MTMDGCFNGRKIRLMKDREKMDEWMGDDYERID